VNQGKQMTDYEEEKLRKALSYEGNSQHFRQQTAVVRIALNSSVEFFNKLLRFLRHKDEYLREGSMHAIVPLGY